MLACSKKLNIAIVCDLAQYCHVGLGRFTGMAVLRLRVLTDNRIRQ